jgi:uncharacterized protein (DUF1778 family)
MRAKNNHRGPRAKAGGKKVKDGDAIPVTIYPRSKTKELIRKAADKAGQSVSRFVLLAAVQRAIGDTVVLDEAKIRKALPADEYNTLVLNQYGPTSGKRK